MFDGKSKRQGKAMQPCEECGKEFESDMYQGRILSPKCTNCRAAQTRLFELDRLERHQRSLDYYRRKLLESPVGIPQKYRGMTWADFKFDRGGERNRVKVEELRKYAAVFPIDDGTEDNPNPRKGVKSVLISRDVNGVGKTLLACLILQDIINRYENVSRESSPFQFWTVADIKLRLKSAQRFGSVETEEDVYRQLTNIPLLVIDDVGKEKMTGVDAANNYEMYFTLVNKRYNNQLPMVITSNLKFEPWNPDGTSLVELMGMACVSRLLEMVGPNAYIIEGDDHR